MSMISSLQQYADELTAGAARSSDWSAATTPTKVIDGIAVTLYSEPAQLADEWKSFEIGGGGCLFQSYRWVNAWSRVAAFSHQEEVLVAVGRDENGRTQFIWPFSIRQSYGSKMLIWSGQDHSSYNFSNCDDEFAQDMTVEKMSLLVQGIAEMVPGVCAVYLKSQPESFDGRKNPFRFLPQIEAANSSYAVQLIPDFSELFHERMGGNSRRNLRRKEKKLQGVEGMEMSAAKGMYNRLSLLDQFFAQKSEDFRERGINDIFAAPSMRSFYRDLVAGEHDDDESFELYSMVADGELLATFNGMIYNGRFYLLLSSLTQSEHRRWSPGLVLMRHHIERCCNAGLEVYDMGAGAADHKTAWANVTTPMFDTFFPVNAVGKIYREMYTAKTVGKRIIKNNPQLWSFAKNVRRQLGQLKKV